MRVCPADNIRSGYLLCALGHPRLGRPQLTRFAFGSSVPEIAPEDVESALLPRLAARTEEKIADLMEEAAQARDEADALEERIAAEAEQLIDRFLAGDREIIELRPHDRDTGLPSRPNPLLLPAHRTGTQSPTGRLKKPSKSR